MKREEESRETGPLCKSERRLRDDPSLTPWMNPLSSGDRMKAIKAEFTSLGRDCPFYDDKVRSRCLVDPHVIFLPECTGRSFSNGICCPKILQSSGGEMVKV